MATPVGPIRRVLKAEAWDLVVLIDNPGLNFHFARVAKAAGRRVLYYIAPQLWAWRPGRMKWIQRRVDHVVVILPFEPELYHRAGVRCTFVGHPLLDMVAAHYDRAKLRREFDLSESARVVGLLPGSRVSEVEMLLPVLLKAAAQLVLAEPGTQFILAQASSIDDNLIQTLLANGLIDEIRLMIFPLVLGKGKRLFGDSAMPAAFKLTKSQTSTTGVIMATYERGGAIKAACSCRSAGCAPS